MQVRQSFVTIFLLGLTIFVKGQDPDICHQLNNDSIKFGIWLVQPDWEKGIFYSETLVRIKPLDSINWVAVKLLKKEDWLKLLNDEKCDWATNLALYELHRKYGGVFSVFNTREKWIDKRKDEDLAYWQKNLK